MKQSMWMATLTFAAAVGVTGAGASRDGSSTALGISGRANATPTIAAADRFVTVVWGASLPAGATDVYSAVSRDGGRTFAPPVRVNDVEGSASLGGEQPPHVSLVRRAGREPAVVVVWTAKSKDGTRLLMARSEDGGASFGHAAPIEGGVAKGNRGWESTTVDREGHVVAVWLDHRETAAPSSSPTRHEGHDHSKMNMPKADGAERAQLSKLYFARVDDPASAKAITGGVCYCCKTSVAAGPDGAIYAAWRHVYPGNIRDIAFTLSRDGGRTFSAPLRVSDDGWALDGCPENGPTLAVGTGGAVHIVWPTLVAGSTADGEPSLALFHAATTDGRHFSPRARLPVRGTPRHPQIVMKADGSFVIAWDEELDGGRRRVVAVSAAQQGSTLRFTPMTINDSARSEYPVVAVAADATLIAWASGDAGQSVVRVQRIP